VGSEAAPRTRARSARSTGNPLLASREVALFRSASASRSGGAVHSCIGNMPRTLNQADGGKTDGFVGASTSRRVRTCSDPPGCERVAAGGNSGWPRRLPSPCGCGVCRARCRCGPVRAASSSPTCCRSKAWSCTPGPRTCDRPGIAYWPSGATGPTGPGNSPPPSRSRPFVALTTGRIERRPRRVIRTMRGTGSFLSLWPLSLASLFGLLLGPSSASFELRTLPGRRQQDVSNCLGTQAGASR
jgi:hypothetical protein